MMRLHWLFLFLLPAFFLAGCAPARPTVSSTTAITIPALTPTSAITNTPASSPTVMVISLTVTPIPIDTLEPEIAKATIEPLLQEPMNCAEPCFWGIVPGKTHLNKVKMFFSHMGFITREGKGFYSVAYKSSSGDGFSTIFSTSGTIIDNIEVTPYIIKQVNESSPREWIAYSPETLIKRYGSPSDVRFTVSSYGMAGSPPNIGINMIMYFDTANLIVNYRGSGMDSENFCPLNAPFDFVRLWIGPNPPDPPMFEAIPLERATSLTIDQFTQLMLGNPQKACFRVNRDANQ